MERGEFDKAAAEQAEIRPGSEKGIPLEVALGENDHPQQLRQRAVVRKFYPLVAIFTRLIFERSPPKQLGKWAVKRLRP